MNRDSHEPINHKARATEYRRAARECADAGYPGIADINWQMAELLDPTPKELPEVKRTPRRRSPVGVAPGTLHPAPGYQAERARRAANGSLRSRMPSPRIVPLTSGTQRVG